MFVVSHLLKMGEDLKMVQCAAGFTESKEQPRDSRWLVRGEGGNKTWSFLAVTSKGDQ